MCKQSDPTKSQVLFGTFSGRVEKDEAAYTKILNFAVWVSHLGRRRGRGGQFDPWTSDPHPLPPPPLPNRPGHPRPLQPLATANLQHFNLCFQST